MRFFGGFAVETDEGPISVRGRGQEALLFRLAVDAGTVVSYRTLAQDLWPHETPEDPRAALQSLASRLRRELPEGVLTAAPGGYRLRLDRADVDLTRFQDLVLTARHAQGPEAAAAAREALDLWVGEPWTPGEGFEWIVTDLLEDAAHARTIAETHTAGAPPEVGFSGSARIPAPATALVGRTRELTLIAQQVASERLVTLVGPGGAGKTTLALETARRAEDAVVVALAPAARGDVWSVVSGAVGRTLRLADSPGTSSGSARDRVVEALAGRTALVLLDNCEHVVEEAASVAHDLLQALPHVRILATSREPLGVTGEAFVTVGPLPSADAEELFARRVRAARATAVTDAEQPIAARIAARLDGLPLALELAAAKARTLSLEEIDEGLADRFALLTGGPRTAERRHRTLRALVDWSWETLTDDERRALTAVSVFPDGVGTTDADAVADAFGLRRDAFDALVERSLLHRSAGRFRMLETVREYGTDRLRENGGDHEARRIQARVMAAGANAHDSLLRGPRVRDALGWFDANEENLAAALRACAEAADLETGLALTRGCLWVWMLRERVDELAPAVLRHSTLPLRSEAATVVRGIAVIAGLFRGARDSGAAEFDEDEAARVARAAEHYPASELAATLPPLLGQAADAWRTRTTIEPWSRRIRRPTLAELAPLPLWSQALLSMLAAVAAQNEADLDAQGEASLQALERFREVGDEWGIAFSSLVRADWLTVRGELEDALTMLDECHRLLEGLVSSADLAQQGGQAVIVLARLGRFDEARSRVAAMHRGAAASGSIPALLHANLAAASVDVAVGDGAAALAALRAIPTSEELVAPQFRAVIEFVSAEALLLTGQVDAAHAAVRRGLERAVATADQPVIAWAARTAALWFESVGREADARRALACSIRLRGRLDASDPVMRGLHERLGAERAEDAPLDAEALRALIG